METVCALVEAGARPDVPLGNSAALGRAVRHRHHAVFQFHDARGARAWGDDRSAILRAARLGDMDTLRGARSRGVDPESLDPQGETALVRAAAFNQHAALEALIAAGAQVAFMVGGSRTALHVAVSEGHREIARTLLPACLAARACGVPSVLQGVSLGTDAAVELLLTVARI